MENLHFDVLICAKGFKFVKISVFTFEKNIFIIKILVLQVDPLYHPDDDNATGFCLRQNFG